MRIAIYLFATCFIFQCGSKNNPSPDQPKSNEEGTPVLYGDEANNGGGLAESNIQYAYQNLNAYIALCLASSSCKIEETEKKLLKSIKEALKSEYKNQPEILFVSEEGSPGFFEIDGNIKIAKTGYAIGDAIYMNQDMIYTQGRLGQWQALSLFEAIGILIHELGHHQGNLSHGELDAIGAKVRAVVQGNAQTIPKGRYHPHIVMNLIDYDDPQVNTELLISDGIRSIALTDKILSAASCERGDFTGFWIYNLHWQKGVRENESWKQELESGINIFCKHDRKTKEKPFGLKGMVSFYWDESGILRLSEEDASFKLIPCYEGHQKLPSQDPTSENSNSSSC